MKMTMNELTIAALCSVLVLHGTVDAVPVPVSDVITNPGFGPDDPIGSGRVLNYVAISDVWYTVQGATCTQCANGIIDQAVDEEVQSSRTAALSGLKYTQIVLNIGATGANFDLGMTIADDTTRILFSEVTPHTLTTGDGITIYPTTNGVNVGSWSLNIVAGDYADTGYEWQGVYGGFRFRSFMTTFRRSDFSGGTGNLVFDGIKIAGNNGIDPNLVAVLMDPVPPVTATQPIPATGIFSPGFVLNPETNHQSLVGIVTSNGTSRLITPLTCVSVTGGDVYQTSTNQPLSKLEALSALSFTEVVANASDMTFAIGRTVSHSDKLRFFLSECEVDALGTMDKIIVYPLYDGSQINTWCLELRSADYGATSPGWKAKRLSDGHTPTFFGSLATFALSDFTNGPPVALSGVDGFKVVCPTYPGGPQADVSVFGMYEMPLKGTVILVY